MFDVGNLGRDLRRSLLIFLHEIYFYLEEDFFFCSGREPPYAKFLDPLAPYHGELSRCRI
jgi:hypothetical protein